MWCKCLIVRTIMAENFVVGGIWNLRTRKVGDLEGLRGCKRRERSH